MPLYSVTYTGNSGEEKLFVDAYSTSSAIRFSKVPRSRVINAKRDPVEEIKRVLTKKPVPLNIQALVVQSIANTLNTGGTNKEAFKDILAENLIENVDMAAIDKCATASDFFAELDFHASVITAAKAGEESDLVGSLENSAQYLQRLANDKKEYGAKIKSGLIYIILGLGFMLLAPLMMGGTLDSFVNENKIQLKLNPASYYLIGSRYFITSYFPLFFVIIGAVWFYRFQIFEAIKGLPGFKSIYYLSTINRSIELISNYALMAQIGATSSVIVSLLFETSVGRNRMIYEDMKTRLTKGESLFQVINNPEWPVSIRLGLKKFDDSASKDRERIYDSILSSLYVEQNNAIEKVTSVAKQAGMTCCLISIGVMGVGFYAPMMGITSAIRG